MTPRLLCESLKCPYLGSDKRATFKARVFRKKFPFSQFSTAGETVEDASIHERGREREMRL